MSDENQQLKPCDHCHGAKVKVHSITGDRGTLGFFCQCDFCWIRTIKYSSRQEAIDSWNNHIESPHQVVATLRAELESAKAEVERLKEACEYLQSNDPEIRALARPFGINVNVDEENGVAPDILGVVGEMAELLSTTCEELEDAQVKSHELESELTATRAKLAEAQKEIEIEEMCLENDVRETLLDRMSQSIAAHFNANIGEHSNLNSPWHEAIRIIDEASPTIPAALLEKLEGALKGSAALIIKRRQGIVDAYEISKVEDLIESALAQLQAFRNGGKV